MSASHLISPANGYLALRTAVLLALLAGPFVAVPKVDAATCSALRSQLASLPSSKSQRPAKSAARKQRREMVRMQSRMEQLRCRERSGLFAREPAGCRAGRRLLRRMEANLAKLQRSASGAANGRPRQRLERKIRRQGCATRNAASKASVRRKPAPTRVARVQRTRAATVRTVCVRPNDGYYFPVSYSTTADGFDRDAQACASLCPGQRMQLYHHPTGRADEPESMVSALDGSTYADLPFAFAFRKRFDSSLACRFDQPSRMAGRTVGGRTGGRQSGSERRVAVADARSFAGVRPTFRPPPGSPPRSGEPGLRGALSGNGARGADTVKRVREVGRSFFPNR